MSKLCGTFFSSRHLRSSNSLCTTLCEGAAILRQVGGGFYRQLVHCTRERLHDCVWSRFNHAPTRSRLHIRMQGVQNAVYSSFVGLPRSIRRSSKQARHPPVCTLRTISHPPAFACKSRFQNSYSNSPLQLCVNSFSAESMLNSTRKWYRRWRVWPQGSD